MSSKVSIIFVPGGWHTAEAFDKLSNLLKDDYVCKPLDLPTISQRDTSKSLADDIKFVQDCAAEEIKQGRRVVIAMHSYGGMVGQSAVKGFNTGDDGRLLDVSEKPIIGLIVIATGWLQANQTTIDALGGKPLPYMDLGDDGWCTVSVPTRDLFYHDLEEEEGEKWVSKLKPMSNKAITDGGEAAYPGWRDTPSWYVMTTEDRAFPVEIQRMGVQAVKDNGADVTVREIQSSHSPMLSRPEETAAIIREAITAFLK